MITPIPRSPAGDILPQKGSSDGIYDGVYATSSMDLRPGYFNKYPRVPLHPIQYSLRLTAPVHSFADSWEMRKTADNTAENILSLSFQSWIVIYKVKYLCFQ